MNAVGPDYMTMPKPDPLTAREMEVLRLIAEGNTTKEIADILGIGIRTVASHRENLMGKLDIHNTAGLVRYAIRTGVINP